MRNAVQKQRKSCTHEVQSVLCVPACHVLQPSGNCAVCTGMSGWARFRQEKRFVVQNPRIIGSYPGGVQIMKFVAVAASVWKRFMKKTRPTTVYQEPSWRETLSLFLSLSLYIYIYIYTHTHIYIYILFHCVDIFDSVTMVVFRERGDELNIYFPGGNAHSLPWTDLLYLSVSHSNHTVARIVKKQ